MCVCVCDITHDIICGSGCLELRAEPLLKVLCVVFEQMFDLQHADMILKF